MDYFPHTNMLEGNRIYFDDYNATHYSLVVFVCSDIIPRLLGIVEKLKVGL